MTSARDPDATAVADGYEPGGEATERPDWDGFTATAAAGDGEVVLDRYRLVRRLGSGGFGVVWLAHDGNLDRPVAVKRIAVADEDAAQRARREGLAAARLSHPGIVALYEAAADRDAVYLVSELVRGHTLAALIADGALSDRDVLRIGLALCDALAHAHQRGVVHRDVKPANVIVPADALEAHRERARGGGPVAAKLTDFGVARIAGDDALTRTGDVVGTLAYMAPEQAEGREAGPAADLYALALCLYEALAGVNPVRGRGAGATARRVGQRLPPLGRLRRDLPLELCDAIDAAVSPHPGERGSVRELRAALRAALPDVGDEPGTIAGGALEPLAPVAPPVRAGVPDRVVAGVCAGGLVTAALALLGPVPPVPAGWAGLGAGLAVVLVPRLAWALAAAALVVWLAVAPAAGGLAVLVAAAAAPVAIALRRARPLLWSAPALGPLLGVSALAGAFPAVAGGAARPLHRAALGALGAWWLLLAEALTGERLAFGTGAAPRAAWEGSAARALEQALWPALTVPGATLIAVWALAAFALPLLVRGRHLAFDVVGAGAWAAGTAAATQAAAGVAPRGLVAGAIVAGVMAVALAAARRGAAELP